MKNKFYNLIILPEHTGKPKEFKIPQLYIKILSFSAVIVFSLLTIIIYDYWKVVNQVVKNDYLEVENRQLKDQLKIFQLRLNTVQTDVLRVKTLEKKLKVITGLSPDLDSKKKNKKFLDAVVQKEKTPPLEEIRENFHRSLMEEFSKSMGGVKTQRNLWGDLFNRSAKLADLYAGIDLGLLQLKSDIEVLEVGINKIDQFTLDNLSMVKSTPTVNPTIGWITSYFGPRQSPYSGRLRMHEGVDIGANVGTNIKAPADGVVVYSGSKPGYGRFLQIDHGYGIETAYGHNSANKKRVGDRVKRGDIIALVGNSGRSTGPHLHYEVRVNGVPVDPTYFILDF